MSEEIIAQWDNLPADFTLEISESKIVRLGMDELRRLNVAWLEAKRELIRRGYRVIELDDMTNFTRKARCVRR